MAARRRKSFEFVRHQLIAVRPDDVVFRHQDSVVFYARIVVAQDNFLVGKTLRPEIAHLIIEGARTDVVAKSLGGRRRQRSVHTNPSQGLRTERGYGSGRTTVDTVPIQLCAGIIDFRIELVLKLGKIERVLGLWSQAGGVGQRRFHARHTLAIDRRDLGIREDFWDFCCGVHARWRGCAADDSGDRTFSQGRKLGRCRCEFLARQIHEVSETSFDRNPRQTAVLSYTNKDPANLCVVQNSYLAAAPICQITGNFTGIDVPGFGTQAA
ncbi:hypothetical protein [Bradyrhizobium sp. cf659]|uniref:hypothetical protein n=1 Tax=Bradyrhizobium sp. cf659 TaxID=1761771 RepID=UPI001FCE0997|nr:hypothetical protein [Bradyrhizobium sp. cf659]